MIQFQKLGIQFKKKTVLENVDFLVPAQKAYGIIGPSGSGKSLILKMIAGILTPTSGSLQVESNRVSMLFQKNALFDSYTLLENLLLPLAETLGIEGDEAYDRSMSLLKAVGLDQSAQLYPDEISGGMQKRLGIARALCIEPEVILYDEPTAGLDPITSRSIADLMIHLHHQNKTTLLMVTNDLQRAYQVCDQLAYCNHGTLKLLGSPTEVKNTGDPEIRNFIYSNVLEDSTL